MKDNIRVRFAPSPTGGLHLGGIRTVLFNYLFAKKHGGKFILRIEDTDQTRFVEGAEEYINECLNWCGFIPDESPEKGGHYAPYRQSERKPMYREYAEQLVKDGHAYYAFDIPEELSTKREQVPNFQYGHEHRLDMRNSLSLSTADVEHLIESGTPHVIRIKMPSNEAIEFTDMIRGHVSFDTNLVDDKVLLKADGMPTYHLAVVVDDFLMKISHAFRGEEWLPSAPVHLLLWKYLGWENQMPQFAHLPLILKPDGHGKLSKRDGERLGFPVFAMSWAENPGFRELGFLPEAFVNMLALLGWNDGTEQELFTMDELIEKFSIERVSKAGAKFDYEKAKWFNVEWIKRKSVDELLPLITELPQFQNVDNSNEDYMKQVLELVKERCVLLPDFWEQSHFFFQKPKEIDLASIQPKWNQQKADFFIELCELFKNTNTWVATDLESEFKSLGTKHNLKVGEIMLPLRIMLVGGKFGPDVFKIVEVLGKEETIERIKHTLSKLK